ncbi:MAG: TIGR02186 family protein [Hyphomonadaceae bacterium]
MRIKQLGIAIGLLAIPLAADAQTSSLDKLAAGLAAETVEVKVNYSGAEIALFAAPPAQDDPSTGLAVALIGPPLPQTIIRNTREGEARFSFHAPAVFLAGAEQQVLETVSPEEMREAGLSAAAAALPDGGYAGDPALETWRTAYVQQKMNEGLYSATVTTIERLDGGLRRARIELPPNAPTGKYLVRAVFFRGGYPVSETEKPLDLVRGGMDATLYDLSANHGVIYGFLAVLTGALIGGAATWVGRR